MSVFNPLQKHRSLRGLTLAELAELSKVSAKTITLIENNRQKATARTLGKLATALNVDIEEFGELLDTSAKDRGRKGGLATAGKHPALATI